MNRAVVTHHRTAWWRNHWATSRWMAGRERLRRSGCGGQQLTGASTPGLMVSLPPLQPDHKTVSQHCRPRMAVEARPQAPLVLIPPPLPCGLLVNLLDGKPAMGIAGHLFQGGGSRQMAPVVLPLLGLAPGGALPEQPPDMPPPVGRDAPAASGDKLLAPPPFGAVSPANRAPRPTGQRVPQLVGSVHGTGRGTSAAHAKVRPHSDDRARVSGCQARQAVGVIALVSIGYDTAVRHAPRPRLLQ
jgi:hypothetical protein